MTPAEVATAILSKTKDSFGKLPVELDHEDGDDAGNEGSYNGEDGGELLLSQKEITTATQKRRNPVRVGKSAQGTIPESQTEENEKGTKSPQKSTKNSSTPKDITVNRTSTQTDRNDKGTKSPQKTNKNSRTQNDRNDKGTKSPQQTNKNARTQKSLHIVNYCIQIHIIFMSINHRTVT